MTTLERDGRLTLALIALTDLTTDLTRLAQDHLTPHVSSNRLIQMLVQVALSPGITPAALAARMGVARSLASQLLRRLLDERLVRRTPVADDHRSVRLSLTARGEGRVGAFETAVVDYFRSHRALVDATLLDLGVATGEGGEPPSSVLEAVTRMASAAEAFATRANLLFEERHLGTNERYALSLVAGVGAMQPAELSRRLQLSSGAISGIVDRLVAAGLALRDTPRGSTDRRVVLVHPTASGLNLVAGLADALGAHAAGIGVALRAVGAASSAAEPALTGSRPRS